MSTRDNALFVQLIQLALGYWRSQVLFTTNDLGVFNTLSEGPKTSEEIGQLCDSSADYTDRLLNAGVAIGLLQKKNGRFHNLRLSEAFLVKGKPQYMGDWIQLMSAWYKPWGRLSEAIYTGKPIEDPLAHLGKSTDYTRHFILAMHNYAMGPGREIVNHLDLTQRKNLLDLGGGPGTHSILLAQENPQLRAIVFDLPPVVKIAKELISSFDLSDRVAVRGGDYLSDDLGKDYDVALLSNMLHQEDSEACKLILQKTYDALDKGGLLVIQAMFLNSQKDGPAWPALHSLLLLLVYQGGRAYTLDETLDMVRKVGFSVLETKRMSLFNAESLIIAKKE